MTNVFQFFAGFIVIAMVYLVQREMQSVFRENYDFKQVNTIPMFMNLPSAFFQSSQAYPIKKSDCFVYFQFKDHTPPHSAFSPRDLLAPLFREYCARKKLFVPYIQEVPGAKASNQLVVERMSRMEAEHPMKFGRERGGLDRVPDALFDFQAISREKLALKLQINDSYYIEYHRNNGFTKTSFKIPEKSLLDKFKEMLENPASLGSLLDGEGRLAQLQSARDSLRRLKGLRLGGALDFAKTRLKGVFEARKRRLKEGAPAPELDGELAGLAQGAFEALKQDNPDVDFGGLGLRRLISKERLLSLLSHLAGLRPESEHYRRALRALDQLYAGAPAEGAAAAQTEAPDIDGRLLEASPPETRRAIEELLTGEAGAEAETAGAPESTPKAEFSVLGSLKQKEVSFPQVNPSEGIVIAEDFLFKNFLRRVAPNLSVVSAISYSENIGTKDSIFNAIFAGISISLLPLALVGHFSVFLYHFKLERFQKTRHLMELHGLRPATYWLVGYCFSFCLSLFSALLFVLSVRVFLGLPVFAHTSPLLLLALYCLWSHSQVSMAVLFQNVSLSPQMASIFAYIISVFNLVGSSYVNSNIFLAPVGVPFYMRVVPELSFTRIVQDFSVACLHDKCFQSFAQIPLQARQSFWYLFGVSSAYLVLGLCIDRGLFACLARKPSAHPSDADASGNYFASEKASFAVTPETKAEEERCLQMLAHSQAAPPSLLVARLSKTYRTSQGKLKAVADLSFSVARNRIFGLLGPNGAGKTTLMKVITSLETLDAGSVQVEGLGIDSSRDAVHRVLGVCPQFDCLYPELTVEDHFLLFIRLRGVGRARERETLARTLKQMGLTEHRAKRVAQLSGGMKRRVSIGIALCGDTKLLLLDEPTSGLDPVNRQQIWEIVKQLKASRAVLLTTHLMDEAEALCDRVGVLVKGQLVTVGSQGFLKSKYARGIHLNVKFARTEAERG